MRNRKELDAVLDELSASILAKPWSSSTERRRPRSIRFSTSICWQTGARTCSTRTLATDYFLNLDLVEMHKTRSRGGGFFRNAYQHTAQFGRQLDNLFRATGHKIRDVAMVVASQLARGNPALASAVGVVGQGAASYSQLRDRLG